MSGSEMITVSACVAAVCSAYRSGGNIVHQIKANRKARTALYNASAIDTSTHELEQSLVRGEGIVQNHFDRDYQRFGEPFASGDQIARDALKDIHVHLQTQVISNLETHCQQDTFVDFTALQDVSDSSQDRAVLVLMQLQQRIVTSGPIQNLTPHPLNPSYAINRAFSAPSCPDKPSPRMIGSVNLSPHPSNGPIRIPDKPYSPSDGPLTPPSSPVPPPYSPNRASPRQPAEQSNSKQAGPEERSPTQDQYKPMATTVRRPGFFGFGKRTKVEPIVSPPENPLVDMYVAAVKGDEEPRSPRSRSSSLTTTKSSMLEPDFNPWEDSRSQTPSSPRSYDRGKLSNDSSRRTPSLHAFPAPNLEILTSNRSLMDINPKDLLPNEINKYAGFCKGAWRQQIGDKKKALEERVRPMGVSISAKYWQCRQCKFEGRLVPVDKKKSGYDMRVFKLVDGIQFRWEFLFKSHVVQKDVNSDPSKATFGCMFCCAEGKGTQIFGGVRSFMDHLLAHKDHLPTGEVLYKMNCLVGRQAAVDEDFDINLVSKEGGLF